MKLSVQLIVIVLLAVTTILLVKLYWPLADNIKKSDIIIPLTSVNKCYLPDARCLFSAGDKKVEIRFSGNVQTMKTFKLLARLSGYNSEVEEVVVDFSMQSMQMGANYFRLVKNSKTGIPGDWQTSVLLPVCTSRRTDWLMNFTVKSGSKIYKVVTPLTIR